MSQVCEDPKTWMITLAFNSSEYTIFCHRYTASGCIWFNTALSLTFVNVNVLIWIGKSLWFMHFVSSRCLCNWLAEDASVDLFLCCSFIILFHVEKVVTQYLEKFQLEPNTLFQLNSCTELIKTNCDASCQSYDSSPISKHTAFNH